MPYKLYKRKGTPYYQARISVKVNGRAQIIRISTHESGRDKAIAVARQAEADLLAPANNDDITVNAAFGEFYTREAQKYTVPRNVFYVLRQMSDFFGADKIFSKITAADINDYIYAMKRDGRAAGTINRHLVVLSSVITTCLKKWRYRAPDVRPLEFREREPDGRIGLVDNNDRLAIMNAAAPHLRLAMDIAYYTGFRRENVLSLRWDEIDFEHGLILKRVKDKTLEGGRLHTVAMPRHLVELLQSLPRTGEYVIMYKDKPIKDIKTAWSAACRRAGFPPHKYTFHDVRHGSGTAVVRATNSLYAAQVHLGHKSPKMTQRYAKFLTEDKIKIARATFD